MMIIFVTKLSICLYLFNIVIFSTVFSKWHNVLRNSCLKYYSHCLSTALILVLLNLAGLPVLAGFLPKFFIMSLISDWKSFIIVLVVNFNFFYFYIKNLKPMLLHKSFLNSKKMYFGKKNLIFIYFTCLLLCLLFILSPYFSLTVFSI